MTVACLDVGRVQVDIRHGDVVEAAAAEHADFFIDPGADPRHRRLRHPGLTPQSSDQVVDLAGRGPGRVRGHDHTPQCLVDPAAGLEQAREERPDPNLRDPQLDIAGRGRQHPRAGAVPLVRSGLAAFVWSGTDRGGQLGVDQVLHALLEQPAEQFLAVTIPEARQQVSNSGIIIMGHRVGLSFVSTWSFSPRVTRWPTQPGAGGGS